MLASELYAISQETRCEGPEECHWCGAPCKRVWMHDDPPPIIGIKGRSCAKRPANLYICVGCWLFRRKRITVQFLDKQSFKDGQSPGNHSWFMTLSSAWVISKDDYQNLYQILLQPPCQFVLSLLTSPIYHSNLPLMTANDRLEIKADTKLGFTINNILHHYTIYELEEALISKETNGLESGVRELINILGPCQSPPVMAGRGEKRSRGRPRKEEEVNPQKVTKIIRISGY